MSIVVRRIITSTILAIMLLMNLVVISLMPQLRAEGGEQGLRLIEIFQHPGFTYMAKFVNETYLVIFTSHGDVSLNGKYISIKQDVAYVYKLPEGKLLGTVTGPGTYRVESWEPFKAVKVWGRNGFFSADSRFMIEDVYHYGTDARVVKVGEWTTIPIDFGFSAPGEGNFYACQLDYDGDTLVVGYIAASKMLVFKYDSEQNKYVKVFEVAKSGHYGRRLQMTLDGKYIFIGGLGYNYLDVYKWNGKTYEQVLHYELPGGIGALGIDNPYSKGQTYVIIGTENGWAVIGIYFYTNDTFKEIYREKVCDSRFYNPFYDRWIPKTTEVFALASVGRVGVVYDIVTGERYIIRWDVDAKAASVSPYANYIFIGNKLYKVQHIIPKFIGEPRLVIEGVTTIPFTKIRGRIRLAPPPNYYITYLKLKITTLATMHQVQQIYIEDKDIREGYLVNLYLRGLVKQVVVRSSGGSVEFETVPVNETTLSALAKEFGWTEREVRILTQYFPVNKAMLFIARHRITQLAYTPPNVADIASAVVLTLPVPEIPVSVYSNLTFIPNLNLYMVQPDFGYSIKDFGTFFEYVLYLIGFHGIPLSHNFIMLGNVTIKSSPQLVQGLMSILEPTAGFAIYYGLKNTIGKTLKELYEAKKTTVHVYAKELAKDILFRKAVEESLGKEALKILEEEGELFVKDEKQFYRLVRAFCKYWSSRETEEIVSRIEEVLLRRARIWRLGERLISKAGTVIGVFLLLDDVISGEGRYLALTSSRTWFGVYAVVQSIETGKKYAVCYLALPRSESENVGTFTGALIDLVANASNIPKNNIMVRVDVTWGRDWKEYADLLAEGKMPAMNLITLVEELVARRYGEKISNLVIDSVNIFIMRRCRGTVGIQELPFGGIEVPFFVLMSSYGFHLIGELPTKLYIDPQEIYNVMPEVCLYNGTAQIRVEGRVTSDGVVYEFNPLRELGSALSFIEIRLPNRAYYASGVIDLNVRVVKEFTDVGFAYNVTLHHAWSQQLRIQTIYLLDMPKSAVYIERIYYYKYGVLRNIVYINESIPVLVELFKDTEAFKLWLRNKNMFELNATYTIGNSTYYAFVSVKNTPWIDPCNGGLLQPCETFTFIYYYKLPPDAGVKIYFNGTKTVGTMPYHIVFKVTSNVNQTVEVKWQVKLMRYNYSLGEFTVYKVYENTNSTRVIVESGREYGEGLIILDAWRYISELMEIAKHYPAYLEIEAFISKASVGNYFRLNDYDRKCLTPLLSLINTTGYNVTAYIYVYDAYTQQPIQNATVEVYSPNGTLVFRGLTNATGYVKVNLTSGITYKVYASASGYMNPFKYGRDIMVFKNGTIIRYPLVPVKPEETIEFILPSDSRFKGNWTHPPYPIHYSNCTILWTLAIEVVYQDLAPYEGAVVEIYEADTSNLLAEGKTNGTGFAFFWIRGDTRVDIHVIAGSYEFWRRNVLVDRALWLVFTVPEKSEYYQPEVALLEFRIRIHRGQGWFYGNVTHLLTLLIWTNVKQNVSVYVKLYDVETNATVFERVYNISLSEGINPVWLWAEVNITKPTTVRGYAKIITYEQDTNLANNEIYSNTVFLKPFVDIKVFVTWEIVKQRVLGYLLPEDVIRVSIGIQVNVNITRLPLHFRGFIKYHTPGRIISKSFAEDVTAFAGIVWRNYTIVVPWASKIVIYVNATHIWEDVPENNVVNETIYICPDVALGKVEVLGITRGGVIREGSVFKVRYYIYSNVEDKDILLYVHDNTLGSGLTMQTFKITGNATIEVPVKAPMNPVKFYIIREPVTEHELVLGISGYDSFTQNNQRKYVIYVYSTQVLGVFIALTVIILLTILVSAVARALVKTLTSRHKKYWIRREKKYWE